MLEIKWQEIVKKYNDVTDQLENSRPNQIVFYRLHEGRKSEEAFEKRLKNSNPGLLVLSRESTLAPQALVVKGIDFLKAQKACLDILFPIPNSLKLIAITGTNGKTTTVHLGMLVSSMLGHPAISIGTVGIRNKNGSIPSNFSTTTPSYIELRKILNKETKEINAVFMEVSSHALIQERIFEIQFDAGAWTSFSQDHLDYHHSMESYFEAKCLLPLKHLKKKAPLFVPALQTDLVTKIKNYNQAIAVTKASFPKQLIKKELPSFFQAEFNKENLSIAFAINEFLWDEDTSNIKLEDFPLPEGRFATIEHGEKMAIVDYAHTPDAVINILKAVRKSFSQKNMIVLFGCGGDRDRSKRPLMGKAADEFADKIYITSDNPRSENPVDIIDDILKGIVKNIPIVEVNRKNAISKAWNDMKKGDILLILGKGHEDYQEIMGVKHPFSDFLVVKECIELEVRNNAKS